MSGNKKKTQLQETFVKVNKKNSKKLYTVFDLIQKMKIDKIKNYTLF